MKRTLLDTDTLSYYLKGNAMVVARATDYLALFRRLDFSVITYYEIRRGGCCTREHTASSGTSRS
jgi:tRNA(fMet)-specific endonuclease VapC